MFFDDLSQLPSIALKTNCVVAVVPTNTELSDFKAQFAHQTTALPTELCKILNTALYLRPSTSDKVATKVITVDQIRDFCVLASHKETSDRLFIITPADTMNESAQNAFLKTFEEPRPHCHFLLLTDQPASLLPTILSRAQIFFLRQTNTLTTPPNVDTKTIALAKQLIAATPRDLVTIAETLAKVKTKPRTHALEVIATAIELLYKSYLKTKNPKFLTKLPQFLQLYDAIAKNGHIKLHFVADLV